MHLRQTESWLLVECKHTHLAVLGPPAWQGAGWGIWAALWTQVAWYLVCSEADPASTGDGSLWVWERRRMLLHAVERQHKLKIKGSSKHRRSSLACTERKWGWWCLFPDLFSWHSSSLLTGLESLFGLEKRKKRKSATKVISNHAGSSTSQHFPLHRIKAKIHLDAGTRHSFLWIAPSCYLVVTLKPKRFNIFYCSICIPDNQTGSWPWGPWRSCRAVPHTHGCSGGKPRGGLQSWTLRCPGCCCPHWGSPHPSVLTLEGSRPGQVVEEAGVGHAFPILLMTI